jgi:uncharacterized protein YndB with AHSA1/START domain
MLLHVWNLQFSPWYHFRSIEMKPITQDYEIQATPAQVFEALTDPALIEKWSGAPARMDAQVGTQFSMFGGNITGTNLEVVPDRKLVQAWYGGDWEEPSHVTFTLVAVADGTRVELRHEDVPEDEVATISQGWKEYYLGPIQHMFEKG